jgi:hypothetical protein
VSPHVSFYTRPGCHLCEVALEVIESVGQEQDFSLDVIDIEGDTELTQRYGDKIPVVLVDGRLHAKYRVDRDAFIRRLGAKNVEA